MNKKTIKGKSQSGSPHPIRARKKFRFSREGLLRLGVYLGLLLWFTQAVSLRANPFQFSYSGRISKEDNTGATGKIDLILRFYHGEADTSPVHEMNFKETNLVDGHFTLSIDLGEDLQKVIREDRGLWIEVVDQVAKKPYPRQRFSVMPFAIKVPVDSNSIVYNADGELTTGSFSKVKLKSDDTTDFVLKISKSMAKSFTLTLPESTGKPNQFLSTDGKGNLSWQTPLGAGDMAKSTYDANSDDKIDLVESCERLDEKNTDHFLNVKNHTETGAPNHRLFKKEDQQAIEVCIPIATDGKAPKDKLDEDYVRQKELKFQTLKELTDELDYVKKDPKLSQLATINHVTSQTNFLVSEGSQWKLKSPADTATLLQLGSAASADVGTPGVANESNGPNQILTLGEKEKMPALDGSSLRDLNPGEIDGTVTGKIDTGVGGDQIIQLESDGRAGRIPRINATDITALNASQIKEGTVPNRFLDTGTAANQILLLEAGGKLPAVSARLVKALNGDKIKTGMISNARLDTGTAANQIVLLDDNGKIPELDGSQITNINVDEIKSGKIANQILDTGTAPNQIVLLDDSGKLPAVDGSKIKNLNANAISSGSTNSKIHPNQLDVGTDPNQIILLEADGALPEAGGALPEVDGRDLLALNGSEIKSGKIRSDLFTASESNEASKLVKRDSQGNIAADGVTATKIHIPAQTNLSSHASNTPDWDKYGGKDGSLITDDSLVWELDSTISGTPNAWTKDTGYDLGQEIQSTVDGVTYKARLVRGSQPTGTVASSALVTKKYTVSDPSTCANLDVTNKTTILINTSSADCVIHGITGGEEGQILYLIKQGTANKITLKHNSNSGTGTKLVLGKGSDQDINARTAVKMVLVRQGDSDSDSDSWYVGDF